MILADKIINERKKNGWSQEDLAEKLSVSRQAISKWESAQATPDLSKVILLAELFGVSTDYLLKDEIEPEDASPQDPVTRDGTRVVLIGSSGQRAVPKSFGDNKGLVVSASSAAKRLVSRFSDEELDGLRIDGAELVYLVDRTGLPASGGQDTAVPPGSLQRIWATSASTPTPTEGSFASGPRAAKQDNCCLMRYL